MIIVPSCVEWIIWVLKKFRTKIHSIQIKVLILVKNFWNQPIVVSNNVHKGPLDFLNVNLLTVKKLWVIENLMSLHKNLTSLLSHVNGVKCKCFNKIKL